MSDMPAATAVWRHIVRGHTVSCPRFGAVGLEQCRECISLVRIEDRSGIGEPGIVACVGDDLEVDDFTWD